jgi:recombination protein RecR
MATRTGSTSGGGSNSSGSVGKPGASWDADRQGVYPAAVARVIDELARLPGIGRRSAERVAMHLLKASKAEVGALAKAIGELKSAVRNCAICWNLTEGEQCTICTSARREAASILVVEQPRDLLALEAAGMYQGVYHVLLGHLSPMDGVGPDALTLEALFERVTTPARNSRAVPVTEVILGLNPTLEGDGTSLHIMQELRRAAPRVKVSRLARGLPAGSSLEFATKSMLADAITGRQPV